MTAMKPDVAVRFRKLCGMLASAHDGERAAAALKATELLKQTGASWADVAVGAATTSKPMFTVWSDVDLNAVQELRRQVKSLQGQLDAYDAKLALARGDLALSRQANETLTGQLHESQSQLQVAQAALNQRKPTSARLASLAFDVAAAAFTVWIAGLVWVAVVGCT